MIASPRLRPLIPALLLAAAALGARADDDLLDPSVIRHRTDTASALPKPADPRNSPTAARVMAARIVRSLDGLTLTAARLSAAAAIVRDEPGISGAELARRVGVGPTRGARLLAEVRATVPDLEAPPPIGSGRSVYVRAATLARLAAVTGRPVGEDVDGQVGDLLDRFATRNPAPRGKE